MIEFDLILKAARKPMSSESFWKLSLDTVAMIAFGHVGEASPWGMDRVLLRYEWTSVSGARLSLTRALELHARLNARRHTHTTEHGHSHGGAETFYWQR